MKKVTAVFLALISAALLLCGCAPCESLVKASDLVFDENGEFFILHMTDMHECLSEKTEFDERNVALWNRLIDETKPNLIVLGGDNIFPLSLMGELFKDETLRTIDAYCEFFNGKEIPWTMTFGNHDDDSVQGKRAMLNRARMNSPYFISGSLGEKICYSFEDKKHDMVNNLCIPIRNADGSVGFNVFVIDSGSERKESEKSLGGYNFIRSTQTKWYTEISKMSKEKAGKTVPAVSFTHIPLYEHKEAYENRFDTSKVLEFVGAYDGYALSKHRSDFFAAAVANGDMKAIFTGHNHTTSFTARVKTASGQMLLSTSYLSGVYYEGGKTYDDNYGRVVKLSNDGSVATWQYQTAPTDFISINRQV